MADNKKMFRQPDFDFFKDSGPFPLSLTPQVIAYLGDAVFELYTRAYLLKKLPGASPGKLHIMAVSLVKASTQALLLREIAGILTEEENDLVRRGRNTRGQIPRGADMADYRYATGLECLLGSLFIAGKRDRLDELMAAMLDKVFLNKKETENEL